MSAMYVQMEADASTAPGGVQSCATEMIFWWNYQGTRRDTRKGVCAAVVRGAPVRSWRAYVPHPNIQLLIRAALSSHCDPPRVIAIRHMYTPDIVLQARRGVLLPEHGAPTGIHSSPYSCTSC